jgi:hypothetical protein
MFSCVKPIKNRVEFSEGRTGAEMPFGKETLAIRDWRPCRTRDHAPSGPWSTRHLGIQGEV